MQHFVEWLKTSLIFHIHTHPTTSTHSSPLPPLLPLSPHSSPPLPPLLPLPSPPHHHHHQQQQHTTPPHSPPQKVTDLVHNSWVVLLVTPGDQLYMVVVRYFMQITKLSWMWCVQTNNILHSNGTSRPGQKWLPFCTHCFQMNSLRCIPM